MVEVNPQEPDVKRDVNIYVAQTSGKANDPGPVLESERSWITIRGYSEEEAHEHGQDIDGDLLFMEFNNMSREAAITLMELALDTLQNGEQIIPEENE